MLRSFAIVLVFAPIPMAAPLLAEQPKAERLFDKDVRSLSVSPDGKTLAVAGASQEIVLWDLAKGKEIRRLKGHTDNVQEVAISPDGKTLVSGAYDKTIRFWSTESGELNRTVPAAGQVTDVCYSPDGNRVAAAFRESTIVQILDMVTGKELRQVKLPVQHELDGTNTSSRVAFSPDGSLLIASCGGRAWPKFIGGDSTISIWETADWSLRTSFIAARFIIYDLAFSPDGRRFAAAPNRDHVVKIWDVPPPKPKVKADDQRIAGLIQQLDSDQFLERESAQQELLKIGAAAKGALDRALQSDSAEVRFRVRAILKKLTRDDLKPLYVLPGTNFDVHAVAFSPNGQWLATGRQFDRPGHVILFKLEKRPRRIDGPHQHGAWVVAFTPNSKQLITGRKDGHITFWDVKP